MKFLITNSLKFFMLTYVALIFLSLVFCEAQHAKSKRNIDEINDELFEQLYIERSVCIDPNNKNAAGLGLYDESTCEEYCKNVVCDAEPQKICGDETWTNYKDYCYKIFTKELTWTQSQAKCEQMNGSLVMINDHFAQKFVNTLIKVSQYIGETFFIGLNRANNTGEDSDFVWTNGEPLTFSNWNEGEPNNHDSVESCVELILTMTKFDEAESRWNDIECDEIRRKFICQKKASIEPRSRDDIVFEFLKYRELSEKNVIEFIDMLNKVTSRNASLFTQSQVVSIVNILIKVSSLPYLPVNATSGFFGTINNLLYAPDEVYQNLKNVSNTLLKTIDTVMTKIQANTNSSQEIKIQVENIAASVNDINVERNRGLNDFTQTFATKDDMTAFIEIKTNFTNKDQRFNNFNLSTSNSTEDNSTLHIVTSRYRLSVLYFKNNKLFQNADDGSDNATIAGTVVSVTVNTLNNSRYEQTGNDVNYKIKYEISKADKRNFWCGYWKFNNKNGGFWSTEGCEYVNYDATSEYHTCKCNHTTHYALLFTPTSAPNVATGEYLAETIILSVITYIGVSLSLIGLSATLITYACFKTLRQGIIHNSLILLAVSLLISNLLFISISILTPDINLIACKIAAIGFHYFILVAFMWMLALSVAQYLTFVKIIDNHITHFVRKASFMAFGMPIIIPATIALLDTNYYLNHSQSICWLQADTLYAGFIVPICVICLINFGFFISILCSIFRRPLNFKVNANIRRNQIGASLCCFAVMGFTWLFGFTLFFNYEYKIVNEIIFCALNSIQGFLIFLFHVLLSKAKRELWSKFLEKQSSITSSSSIINASASKSQSKSNKGAIQQTIKLKFGDMNAFSSSNANKIIVHNNNIIIDASGAAQKKNTSSISTERNNSTSSTKTVSSTTSDDTSPTILAATLALPLQHHHYHHHVHHYKSSCSDSSSDDSIKAKKTRKFCSQDLMRDSFTKSIDSSASSCSTVAKRPHDNLDKFLNRAKTSKANLAGDVDNESRKIDFDLDS